MTILGPYDSHLIITEEPGFVHLTVEHKHPSHEDGGAMDHTMTIEEAEELIRTLKLAIFRAQGFDQGGALATLPEQ